MDCENHLEDNPSIKIEKTAVIKVKLPHVNKKAQTKKRIFDQTSLSH